MRRYCFFFLLVAVTVGCSNAMSGGSAAALPLCGDASVVSQLGGPESAVRVATAPAELSAADRVGFPASYRETFRRFYVFDRIDARSVSYVCANEIAAGVAPGEPYPYGSVLLFESWRPLIDDQNNLVLDGNGHLIRSALTGVFLMRKERGFGASYGESRSGEWEYVAFRPDGTYQTPPETSQGCAACHNVGATGSRDFVFRTAARFLPNQYGHSDPVNPGEIGISRMSYPGGNRTVPVGTTVVWRNSTIDDTPHTVVATGGGFASPTLGPGETFSFTFTAPGVYAYNCALHPGQMRGTITVE